MAPQTYAEIWRVPITLAPICKQHRQRAQITLPHTYQPVPENIANTVHLEKSVLASIEKVKEDEMILLNEQAMLQEKRKQRLKAKTPGLSADNEILQPTKNTKNSISSSTSVKNTSHPTLASVSSSPPRALWNTKEISRDSENKSFRRKNLDFLEFEHGLAPPDPWDTRHDKDDLTALKEVLADSITTSLPATTSSTSTTNLKNSSQIQPNIPSENIILNPSSASTDPLTLHLNSLKLSSYQSPLSNAVYENVPPPQKPLISQEPPQMPPKPFVASAGFSSTPAASLYPSLLGSNIPENSSVQNNSIANETFSPQFESYMAMGFSKQGIEHAQERFGEDDSKYLDYLVAHDHLVTKGFKTEDVDSALSMFDESMAESFLASMAALCELGFNSSDVKDALLLKQLDREHALEHLMNA